MAGTTALCGALVLGGLAGAYIGEEYSRFHPDLAEDVSVVKVVRGDVEGYRGGVVGNLLMCELKYSEGVVDYDRETVKFVGIPAAGNLEFAVRTEDDELQRFQAVVRCSEEMNKHYGSCEEAGQERYFQWPGILHNMKKTIFSADVIIVGITAGLDEDDKVVWMDLTADGVVKHYDTREQ